MADRLLRGPGFIVSSFLGVKTLLPDVSMETHAGFPEAIDLFLGSGCPFPQGYILQTS